MAVEADLRGLRLTWGDQGWAGPVEEVEKRLRQKRMLWSRTEESEALKFVLPVSVCGLQTLQQVPHPAAASSQLSGRETPREQLLETIHGRLSMVSSTFFQKSHTIPGATKNLSVWHRQPSWEFWESSSIPLFLYQQLVSIYSPKLSTFPWSVSFRAGFWILWNNSYGLLNWDH